MQIFIVMIIGVVLLLNGYLISFAGLYFMALMCPQFLYRVTGLDYLLEKLGINV